MSLDVTLTALRPTEVFEYNITHNLTCMADEAGLYQAIWQPEELGAATARDLIGFLVAGLARLRERPDYYRTFNPSNGWGDYEGLVKFAETYLAACRAYPDAMVNANR